MKDKTTILNNKCDEVTNADYLEIYKTNIKLKEQINSANKEASEAYDENRKLKNKHEKEIATMGSVSVAALLIAAFISFCVGSCMNGCAGEENHYVRAPFIIQNVSSDSNGNKVYYLGSHVYLVGGKESDLTAGDTLNIGKY